MPYKSDAQRRYFHANKDKLRRSGVNVAEWDRASKGKKLPKRVRRSASTKTAEIVSRAVKFAESIR